MSHDPRALERLEGKVALITGASSGIGRAVALRFAAAGLKVCALARRKERLDALVADIAAQSPGAEVLTAVCDVRDETQIDATLKEVRARHGGIDVLVNNAGLGRKAPLMSGATADWREMLETNVLALAIFTREAISDMRARGDEGHIVHISSMAGHRIPLESGVYSATKFAVRSMTEGLRRELRAADSGIRVTAVSPGFVETEFAEVYHRDGEAAAKTYGRYPVLTPDDIADAVAFAVGAPPHMQVHDLLVRPTRQPD
jgi:NADP-dependent 3-hydroxy acid dehydrogenase YdfG